MTMSEDYQPCRYCGELCDGGVCDWRCEAALRAEQEAAEQADDDSDDRDDR